MADNAVSKKIRADNVNGPTDVGIGTINRHLQAYGLIR